MTEGSELKKVHSVAGTRSTNDDVAALARDGAPEGLWLRADRQTGGRGRQGRAWISPPGNLHASTLVRLRPGDPPAPTLALVAAVALHEATAQLLRHSRESGNPASLSPLKDKRNPRFRRDDRGVGSVLIKWPNDLLLRSPAKAGAQDDDAAGPRLSPGSTWAKLAGILLEREGDAVVVGFGANLAHSPPGLDRPVTSIAAATGAAPDPAAFVEALAEAFTRWLARWRSEGLAPVRAAWLAAAHPIGTPLSTPEGEGRFDGLDETGALRLRFADGSVPLIHAGDVFLI